MLTVSVQCIRHKKYKAIYKPRITCEGCWFMWELAHSPNTFPFHAGEKVNVQRVS